MSLLKMILFGGQIFLDTLIWVLRFSLIKVSKLQTKTMNALIVIDVHAKELSFSSELGCEVYGGVKVFQGIQEPLNFGGSSTESADTIG